MTMAGNEEFEEMYPATIFAFIPQVYRNSRDHLGMKKCENIHTVCDIMSTKILCSLIFIK